MKQEANEFTYMLLSRLQSDCNYFLGYGGGNERNLWADTIKEHTAKMIELWDKLPTDGKPEWLSMEDIKNYEKRMLAYDPEKDCIYSADNLEPKPDIKEKC